jgi:hypothetical protein
MTDVERGEAMAQGKESVAFLDTDTMGRAMATRALGAGIPTIVWNREPGATRDLADLGAEVAESGADAAGSERFETLAALAEEWEELFGLGIGDSDLTVVTQALEQQGGHE